MLPAKPTGAAICGTLTGASAERGPGCSVGGVSWPVAKRKFEKSMSGAPLGRPSSRTLATSVAASGSVTGAAASRLSSGGRLSAAWLSNRPGDGPPTPGGLISHSGCSQATARSVRPLTVTSQISRRSPQAAGTGTLNA